MRKCKQHEARRQALKDNNRKKHLLIGAAGLCRIEAGHLPPPALGDELGLAGTLLLPVGAGGTPLTGGVTASGPGARL